MALPFSLQNFILGIYTLQKLTSRTTTPFRKTTLLVLTPSENLIYRGGGGGGGGGVWIGIRLQIKICLSVCLSDPMLSPFMTCVDPFILRLPWGSQLFHRLSHNFPKSHYKAAFSKGRGEWRGRKISCTSEHRDCRPHIQHYILTILSYPWRC